MNIRSKFTILTTPENIDELRMLIRRFGMTKHIYHDGEADIFYNNYFSTWNGYAWRWDDTILYDYPIINTTQFRLLNRNIIGYKCPVDLMGGLVIKKDTTYIPHQANDTLYIPDIESKTMKYYYSVPKEIAQTWEPVFGLDSDDNLMTSKEWKLKKWDNISI